MEIRLYQMKIGNENARGRPLAHDRHTTPRDANESSKRANISYFIWREVRDQSVPASYPPPLTHASLGPHVVLRDLPLDLDLRSDLGFEWVVHEALEEVTPVRLVRVRVRARARARVQARARA